MMKINLVEIINKLNDNGVCNILTKKNTGVGGYLYITFLIDEETHVLKIKLLTANPRVSTDLLLQPNSGGLTMSSHNSQKRLHINLEAKSPNLRSNIRNIVQNLQYDLELGLHEIIPNAIKDLNMAFEYHNIALIELDSEDCCHSDFHYDEEDQLPNYDDNDLLPNPDGSRTT